MSDFTWTDEDIDLSGVDALEIAGCTDDGTNTERVDDDKADFWSVYIHITGQGCECVADRNTPAEAEAFAAELSKRGGGLPINRFYSEA